MAAMYTVHPTQSEGLGCFANIDISPGTLILSEVPLFSVREPRDDFAVVEAFSELSKPQQDDYLTLYAVDAESQGSDRVNDIFNSNAWQTGSRTSILLNAARFNHSCIPNATLAWNSRLSCVTVYAITTISAGAQIYLCYVRPYQLSATRQLKLSSYGFVCACSACGSDCTVSDNRRARMIVLDAKIRIARRQKWRKDPPREALELVTLLKDEGIISEALGLAYHDASVGWRKMGNIENALDYALKELEICTMCFGDNSSAVDSSSALVAELKLELSLPTKA
ncbi:hypothetical protein EJ08DRAFT_70040 [Tothia fuscella]|uniref:SET domain-containing protein n=1 Tax=Tothia fuscella TaxID=1048955 RepID=A0A9P4NEL5_9PEZI|nr:hypothetical protein EJ08DRAFT_70040 [Tothia fuscella]